MEVFTAASHHDVLVLIVQVCILLLSARLLGELAQRLKQPAVVGELLAGIILGPSLLSGFFPVIGQWIVPHSATQGYLIEVVSMFGAMFLLIITGLETDIPLIRKHKKKAFGIAAGGLILPFLSGFIMAHYLPDSLLADPNARVVFNLFIATAMSISSIPVIAKVLMDLNLMRRDLGQTILASGMIDDTTAWILLSIILGIASGEALGTVTVLYAILKIIAFFTLSFTAGRWLVKKGLHFVQDYLKSADIILTFVIVVAFFFGAIAQAIQVEAVLGAFVAGIIFGTLPRLPKEVIHKIESVALAIFAPIFFAVSGLKVNIVPLFHPELLLVTGVVLAIAILGKLIGAYTGARIVGIDHWSAFSYGSALNARGAVEIIIASIGLSMGILSQNMYSIIVLMAMTTSLMAPSLLKWSVSKMKMGKEEEDRLKREAMAAGSTVAKIHRVLIPVQPLQGKPDIPVIFTRNQLAISKVLDMFGDNNHLSISLLTIAPKPLHDSCKAYLKEVSRLFKNVAVEIKVNEGTDQVEAILNVAKKNYDLLVISTTDNNKMRAGLFTEFIDDLVRRSPCPTCIIKGDNIQKNWKPSNVLIPVDGSKAARNAAELGFYLKHSDNYRIRLLHVVARRSFASVFFGNIPLSDRGTGTAILKRYHDWSTALNVSSETVLMEEKNRETAILKVAKQTGSDLILIGTSEHPTSERLYLGSLVEAVLNKSDCPVLIFNT